MTKEDRIKIYNKYSGRCAYCGKDLKGVFHIDHIQPIRRNTPEYKSELDNIDNMNPACPSCNRYKGTMTLENFRKELSQQVERARRSSKNFRFAEIFGLVVEVKKPIVFYFETQQ